MALISKENRYITPKSVVASSVLGVTTAAFPEQVASVVGNTYGAVDGILSTIGNFTDNVISSGLESLSHMGAPFAGALAPFAAPMLAGGYVGKKLADVIKLENKILRGLAMVAGTGLGFAAAGTTSAPYLVGGAAVVGLGKSLLRMMNKTLGVPVGGLVGGGAGFVNGSKDGMKEGWTQGVTNIFKKERVCNVG